MIAQCGSVLQYLKEMISGTLLSDRLIEGDRLIECDRLIQVLLSMRIFFCLEYSILGVALRNRYCQFS